MAQVTADVEEVAATGLLMQRRCALPVPMARVHARGEQVLGQLRRFGPGAVDAAGDPQPPCKDHLDELVVPVFGRNLRQGCERVGIVVVSDQVSRSFRSNSIMGSSSF